MVQLRQGLELSLPDSQLIPAHSSVNCLSSRPNQRQAVGSNKFEVGGVHGQPRPLGRTSATAVTHAKGRKNKLWRNDAGRERMKQVCSGSVSRWVLKISSSAWAGQDSL